MSFAPLRIICIVASLNWPTTVAATEAGDHQPLRLAVASNFRNTIGQLNKIFSNTTNYPVLVSAASTGVLYTQITKGAPFDLLLAADTDAPHRLEQAGLLAKQGRRCYAVGRLMLASRHPDQQLSTLSNAKLSLAIANPATAPYGRAALSVLARPEFSAASGRKLVRGNNVLQAWQYWKSNVVDLALVPASLATGGIPIPPDWHQPLEQQAALLKSSRHKPAAQAYFKFLGSNTAQQLIQEAGYGSCS